MSGIIISLLDLKIYRAISGLIYVNTYDRKQSQNIVLVLQLWLVISFLPTATTASMRFSWIVSFKEVSMPFKASFLNGRITSGGLMFSVNNSWTQTYSLASSGMMSPLFPTWTSPMTQTLKLSFCLASMEAALNVSLWFSLAQFLLKKHYKLCSELHHYHYHDQVCQLPQYLPIERSSRYWDQYRENRTVPTTVQGQ